jgi:hypothetical protein
MVFNTLLAGARAEHLAAGTDTPALSQNWYFISHNIIIQIQQE